VAKSREPGASEGGKRRDGAAIAGTFPEGQSGDHP
jgi:hypothetical protein